MSDLIIHLVHIPSPRPATSVRGLALLLAASSLFACGAPPGAATVRVSGTVSGHLGAGSALVLRDQVIAPLAPQPTPDDGAAVDPTPTSRRTPPMRWTFAFDAPRDALNDLGALKVREPSPCGPEDHALEGAPAALADGATTVDLSLYLNAKLVGRRHVRVTLDNPGAAATFTWGALAFEVGAASLTDTWAPRPTCAGELAVTRAGQRLGATLPDPRMMHLFVSARPDPCFVTTLPSGTDDPAPTTTRHTSSVITSSRVFDRVLDPALAPRPNPQGPVTAPGASLGLCP